MYAKMAGIRLPLKATKGRPLMIRTVSYFKDGVHPDPGNVQKGVCDALFYNEDPSRKTKKGDDKYTGGSFPPPLYDKSNPRVVVIIKDYAPKRRKKDGEEEQGRKQSKEAPGKARAKAPKNRA